MSIGFHRTGAPRALTRSEAAEIIRPVAFAAIEALMPPRDPFNIADPCVSPDGHLYIAQGVEIFCPHCHRRFW
jgi:hypothetical protein